METKMELTGTLVAFDLDDTLVPEALFLRSGIEHVAMIIHKNFPEIEVMRAAGCMHMAVETRTNHYSALERLFDENGIRLKVDMKTIVEELRSHMPDVEIYHPAPSVISTLEELKERGATLALVTDGRSVTQRNKIRAAGLQPFIEDKNILISGETGQDKSHPYNFVMLMERNPEAKNFIYVGDNPRKDFLHPRLLGWRTFCVPSFPLSIHPHSSIPAGVFHIPSVQALTELL